MLQMRSTECNISAKRGQIMRVQAGGGGAHVMTRDSDLHAVYLLTRAQSIRVCSNNSGFQCITRPSAHVAARCHSAKYLQPGRRLQGHPCAGTWHVIRRNDARPSGETRISRLRPRPFLLLLLLFPPCAPEVRGEDGPNLPPGRPEEHHAGVQERPSRVCGQRMMAS